jgi:hypothetical protein
MATPTADPALQTALEAWSRHVSELEARTATVLAETGAQLDSLIAQGADGVVPFETAIIEAETQLAALRRDLDAARGDLEHAFGQSLEGAPAEGARALRWQRSELRKQGVALARSLEERTQRLLVGKQAELARRLFERASEEWNEPRPCRSCGGPIVVGGVWQPTNFTCDACGTVTTVHPAPQTASFYRDGHLAQICAEAALDEWIALQSALDSFRKLACPTSEDFEPVEAAAQAWARTQHELRGQLDPTWGDADVASAVARSAREALADLGDAEPREDRAAMAAGSTIAATGDLGAVLSWARERGDDPAPHVAALAVCLHEHGQRGPAWQVLALQHHVQRVAEDRDGWMRGELARLDEDLRTR